MNTKPDRLIILVLFAILTAFVADLLWLAFLVKFLIERMDSLFSMEIFGHSAEYMKTWQGAVFMVLGIVPYIGAMLFVRFSK